MFETKFLLYIETWDDMFKQKCRCSVFINQYSGLCFERMNECRHLSLSTLNISHTSSSFSICDIKKVKYQLRRPETNIGSDKHLRLGHKT